MFNAGAGARLGQRGATVRPGGWGGRDGSAEAESQGAPSLREKSGGRPPGRRRGGEGRCGGGLEARGRPVQAREVQLLRIFLCSLPFLGGIFSEGGWLTGPQFDSLIRHRTANGRTLLELLLSPLHHPSHTSLAALAVWRMSLVRLVRSVSFPTAPQDRSHPLVELVLLYSGNGVQKPALFLCLPWPDAVLRSRRRGRAYVPSLARCCQHLPLPCFFYIFSPLASLLLPLVRVKRTMKGGLEPCACQPCLEVRTHPFSRG